MISPNYVSYFNAPYDTSLEECKALMIKQNEMKEPTQRAQAFQNFFLKPLVY